MPDETPTLRLVPRPARSPYIASAALRVMGRQLEEERQKCGAYAGALAVAQEENLRLRKTTDEEIMLWRCIAAALALAWVATLWAVL